jgi:hypothetical protein
MKTRILVVTLVVMMMSVLFVNGQEAQAQAPLEAMPRSVIFDLFAALNVGDMDSALASFGEDASLGDSAGGRTYLNSAQIAARLAGWQHEGRQYRILQESTFNVARGLDVVFSDVEVSDEGMAWGQQSIVGLVYNGQIQRLDVAKMRLTPIQYWNVSGATVEGSNETAVLDSWEW